MTLHKSIMFLFALGLVWFLTRSVDAQENTIPLAPTTVDWRAEYFNNPTLSGEPVLTRTDPAIDFNWAAGSPAADAIPAEGFSVRWTGAINLQPGRYRFTAIADDGLRLWVNELPIFDAWTVNSGQPLTVAVNLPGGTTDLRVEYFENTGDALVRLNWAPVNVIPLAPAGTALPTAAPTITTTGTVTGTTILNIRNGPGVEFARIGALRQAEAVTIVGRNSAGDWAQIRLADGQLAWISREFLSVASTFATLPVASGTAGANTGGAATATVVDTTPLNVRSGPSLTAPILRRIPGGATVTLQGRNSAGDWVQIQAADNQVGWVSAQFLTPTTPITNLPVIGATTEANANVLGTGQVSNAVILNVRSGPAITFTRIATLAANQTLNLVGRNQDGSWLQVELADGRLGWVNRPYVTTTLDITTLPVRQS
jgi:uncharacterized protein YgiM (DUF1202 family)